MILTLLFSNHTRKKVYCLFKGPVFIFAFLFMCVAPGFLVAQTRIWDKTIGADYQDKLSVMVAAPNGGYLLGGSSNSDVNGDRTSELRNGCDEFFCETDFWVVKLDANGKKVWDKVYGGYGSDDLQVIVPTPDGGFLLGGTSDSGISSEKSQESKGNTDYWIIKITASGEKVWDTTFGSDCHEYLQAIVPTADGGFMLGGTSESGIGGDKTEENKAGPGFTCGNIYSDYWVVKMNANGQKEWDRTFGGLDQDIFSAMVASPDGSFLLGGTSDSGTGGDKSQARIGRTDYWVVKMDAAGQKIWDKTIGGTNIDELTTLVATPNQGYLLGGTSFSGISGDKTQPSKGNEDYWLVRLDTNGETIWDQTFGGIDSDLLQASVPMPGGGFLVGGSSASGIDGEKTENSRGATDYWVLRIDSEGQKVWDKTIGGTNADYLQSLILTPDNNCLLGGSSVSGSGSDKTEENRSNQNFTEDYWVVKLSVPTKNVQTIAFNPISDKILNDPPFPVMATASSGLPITFSILSGPAIIRNNKVVLNGVGTVVVKAVQKGNANFSPTESIQLFRVNFIPKQWDKTFGGSEMERFSTLIPTADGGYLVGGTSSSGRSGDKTEFNKSKGGDYDDIWILKIDTKGNKVWDRTFGGDFGAQIAAIVPAPDGGFLLGGSSASGVGGDKTEPSKGYTDYWLIKIDADGNKIWDRTLGGPDYDYMSALIATPDGGYLLGGQSSSGMGGDKTEESRGGFFGDFWVVKVDAQGNKVWDKTLGGSEDDALKALVATPDGGFLVGGDSFSGVSGDKSQPLKRGCADFENGCADFWVIKISNTGQKIWDRTLGGQGDDRLFDMVASPDGGFLLGGTSNSRKGADKSEPVKGYDDYWLLKIDATGKKQWDNTLGGNGSDQLYSIVHAPDGGYLVGGTSGSEAGGDKSESSMDPWDYWVVRINANGQKVWDETFGTSEQDLFAVLTASPDGYVVGGVTNAGKGGDKTEESRGGYDYWLVKLQEILPTDADWNMRYGGSDNENLTDVIRTRDGGYLTGGYSASGSSGDKSQGSQGRTDFWIVKNDKNGSLIWEKRFGGTADDYLSRIIQTQDGGYLLGGSSLSGVSGDKSQKSQGDRDFWVVKVDRQGNKEWDRTFGGSGTDELRKVVQLSTGEFVLGGYSNSPVSGDKTQPSQGGNDYWMVKISNTGTKIWDKRYGGSRADLLGSFTGTSDGGFLLAGSSISGKSGEKSEGSRGGYDYWLVRTDKDGNLVWDKTYGGYDADDVYSVGRTGNDYFIAGTSSSGASGDKSQPSQGGKDYWLLKVNASGAKIWDKGFGGSKDDELRASTFTRDRQFVLAGTSFSDISGDKTQASRGESDYWIVRLSNEGNKIQDQRFGGSGAEELRTVFQTQDGGLLLGGRSASGVSGDRSQPSQGGTDYWLVKIAPPTTTQVARVATTEESAVNQVKDLQVQAYPNPFSDRATISFALPETQPATVKVFDSRGQEVATLFQGEAKSQQRYEVEWKATNKAAGLYIVQLQTPAKNQQYKLLLSK